MRKRDKYVSTTIRQLEDIIQQLNNIEKSINLNLTIKEISIYSIEINNFILVHFKDGDIAAKVNEIPNLTFEKNIVDRQHWYHYLIFPWYLIPMISNEISFRELQPDIKKSILLYSQLIILIGNFNND